ncbi:NADH-quinone oxidoreductase subunit N [Candidatus Poribacteria bacterium]|nr:NADH-quinone oxidoreductase subunit N [Candidatus Poribacteria bacterium]
MVDFDWGALSASLVLLGTATLTVLFDMGSSKRWAQTTAWIALIGTVTALGLELASPARGVALSFGARDRIGSALPVFLADGYTHVFTLIFLIGAALAILLSMAYLERHNGVRGEYYILLLTSLVGMILMAGGNDLIVIFLGLELMSLPLYVLAGFRRNRESSESSLKYFLLGAFSSGFFLYGIALIYGATGSTNLRDIAGGVGGSGLLGVGVVLLVVGLAFKVAAVPFHQWAPDVYQGAPTPVTAFFASSPKVAAFAAIARLFVAPGSPLAGEASTIFAVLAVLTMSVGNLVALTQKNVKRMLAYSSIAHAGYVLVAFAAGESGAQSGVFYLLVYSLMSIGAFGTLILAGSSEGERLNLDDYNGMGFRKPFLGVVLSVFMLSLAGFPPMAGFLGKFLIFRDAWHAGLGWLVIAGVLNSVVSAFFYLGVIVRLYMADAPHGAPAASPVTLPQGLLVVALLIALAGVVIGGVAPGGLMGAVDLGAASAATASVLH